MAARDRSPEILLALAALGVLAACSSDRRPASAADRASADALLADALGVRAAFDAGAAPALPNLPAFALEPGCVARDADRLVFRCAVGDTRVAGTMVRTGDRLVVDLRGSGARVFALTGDLLLRNERVDGTLALTVSAPETSVRENLTFDRIALDRSGCAVGGRLRSSVDVKGAAERSRSLEAEFGPACGEVVTLE